MIAVRAWFRRWRAARAARVGEERGDGDGAGDEAGDAGDEAGDAAEREAAADEPDAAAPLADELDLHTFLPRECADVVAEYLHAAQEAGLPAVRIIHGKGTGALRRTVHAVLERHPAVRAFRLAGQGHGGWGATIVELAPRPPPPA